MGNLHGILITPTLQNHYFRRPNVCKIFNPRYCYYRNPRRTGDYARSRLFISGVLVTCEI